MLGKAKFYKNGYQILRRKILEDFYDNMYNNIAKVANQQDKAKNDSQQPHA